MDYINQLFNNMKIFIKYFNYNAIQYQLNMFLNELILCGTKLLLLNKIFFYTCFKKFQCVDLS